MCNFKYFPVLLVRALNIYCELSTQYLVFNDDHCVIELTTPTKLNF